MKDLVNEWLLLTREHRNGLPQVRKALVFPDHKLCLSIQASEFHYCTPKDNVGPYVNVEVGVAGDEFPPELEEYRERWDDEDAHTPVSINELRVCGFVPVDVLNSLLDRLGAEFLPTSRFDIDPDIEGDTIH